MHSVLAAVWWVLLLRGIAAVVFGIIALAWPGLTFEVLLAFWGAYAFVDGCFSLWAAFSGSTHNDRWLIGLQGVIGILAGAVTFFWPLASAVGIAIAIGVWCMMIGLLQIVSAIRLRKEIKGEFWLGLSGLIAVIFGMLIIAQPFAGVLTLVLVLGIYAIAFGVMLIALAFRVKNHPLTSAVR